MKKLSMIFVSVLIFGTVFPCVTASAQANNTNQLIYSNVSTINESAAINESCPVNVTETVDETTVIPVGEQKFRVGPTVVLRPVNDVITENDVGVVELYIDNPSLNDVVLNVDARISVPAGIHIYGDGFGLANAAGTVSGIFSVPPGSARTIYIDVKGEKVGTSTVHFTGLYWPGDNKDNYNPISLTHPFTIKEPSKNPTEAPDSGVQAEGSGSFSAPGFGAIIASIGLLGVYIFKRK